MISMLRVRNVSEKEISILRLAVTNKCILSCRYCFVAKGDQVISYSNAKKAVKLLLISPGKEKMINIYGGEPLIVFNLLKDIIHFSLEEAKRRQKKLIVSVATNSILLTESQIDFFVKTNTKLSLSLDGKNKFHDKFRTFKNGRGSFKEVVRKLGLLIGKVKKENLCVLFGVVPEFASSMYDNFIYLNKLGFDCINIEPIKSNYLIWSSYSRREFQKSLVKAFNYIYSNISKRNFIFLNSVNKEIKDKRLSNKNMCLFFENLEINPKGEIAFSPFLINSKHKSKYIVGDINKKYFFNQEYGSCRYNQLEDNCRNCWERYNCKKNYRHSPVEEVVKLRNSYSLSFSKKILDISNTSQFFKDYILESTKRVFE